MALRIEKPGKRVEYVLKADRESSAPTKFFLRPITWEEKAEMGEVAAMTLEQALGINAITSSAAAEKRELTEAELKRIAEIAPLDASGVRRLTKQHAIAVRYGVVDVEGMLDRDDQPLKMSGAELARFLTRDAILELGTEIVRLSSYSEDAIKK
jgi:hypothetical protein